MIDILITGAGGYIGSHVLRLLSRSSDFNITIIDNFSTGFKEPIDIISKESKNPINLIEIDLRNNSDLNKLKNKRFAAVLHFAALIKVNESMEKPLDYFENNVNGTINLLKYMKETKCDKLIFSSTSALYSRDAKLPFTEESLVAPENPYALSKLMMEQIISWCNKSWDLKSIILRYFNPCGCSLDTKIGYSSIPATHLMVSAIRGALGLQDFEITCGKVNTPDGTTIRDYFNVLDLSDTHKIALGALLNGHKGGIFNVGIGKGHSVLEIVNLVKKVTGVEFKIKGGKKREGELPIVYCNPKKFREEFNWNHRYTLEQAVESLVKWFKRRPSGYNY